MQALCLMLTGRTKKKLTILPLRCDPTTIAGFWYACCSIALAGSQRKGAFKALPNIGVIAASKMSLEYSSADHEQSMI